MKSRVWILVAAIAFAAYLALFVPWGVADDLGQPEQYVTWTSNGSLVRLSQVFRGTALGVTPHAALILPHPRYRVWEITSENGTSYGAPQPFSGYQYPPSILNGSLLWAYQSSEVGGAGVMHIERSSLGTFSPFRTNEDIASFKLMTKAGLRDVAFSPEGNTAVAVSEADHGVVVVDLRTGQSSEFAPGWAAQPQFTRGNHVAFYQQRAAPSKPVALFSESLLSKSYRGNLRKGERYSIVLADRNGRVLKSMSTSVTNYASQFSPEHEYSPFPGGLFNSFRFEISPDENLIATHEGVFDWSGKAVAKYPSPIVSGPAWSPDGKEVAGVTKNGSVQRVRIE